MQRIVIIKVLSFVKVGHGFIVVPWVDDSSVADVGRMRIAVDGKFSQTLEPLGGKSIVGEESESGSEHICFPSVFLSFGVAYISCGNIAIEFVIALSLEH